MWLMLDRRWLGIVLNVVTSTQRWVTSSGDHALPVATYCSFFCTAEVEIGLLISVAEATIVLCPQAAACNAPKNFAPTGIWHICISEEDWFVITIEGEGGSHWAICNSIRCLSTSAGITHTLIAKRFFNNDIKQFQPSDYLIDRVVGPRGAACAKLTSFKRSSMTSV